MNVLLPAPTDSPALTKLKNLFQLPGPDIMEDLKYVAKSGIW